MAGPPENRVNVDVRRIRAGQVEVNGGAFGPSRPLAYKWPGNGPFGNAIGSPFGRAIMTQPRLLILDEPPLGLAPILVEHILGLSHRLAEAG